MIKGKWKILICTLLVACILFVTSNDVFAAINEDYYYNNVADNLVVDSNLGKKLSQSTLVSALGQLIYGIGSLMEWVLGAVFKAVTGTNIFPWADAILFNAIPFLDVNVFTAAQGSLVASLQGFIAGMYYTILTLANTFFGLAIMVTAIKLVLTAIAEDKAKYKKAIVDWILGLVMLWGIHFFISFALYLNEELVKAASTMASASLQEAGDRIVAVADTTEYKYEIVENFVYDMLNGGITLGDIGGIILTVVGVIVIVVGIGIACGFTFGAGCVAGVALATVVKGCLVALTGAALYVGGVIVTATRITQEVKQGITVLAKAISTSEQMELGANEALDAFSMSEIKKKLYAKDASTIGTNGENLIYDPVSLAAELLSSDIYTKYWWGKIATSGKWYSLKESGSEIEVAELYFDMTRLVGNIEIEENGHKETILAIDFYRAAVAVWDSIPMSERIESSDVNTKDDNPDNDRPNYDAKLHALYRVYVSAYDKCVLKQASETSIITNLATYFKETAWTLEDGAWQANKSVIQNALMYAILVVQSLIFFIAYAKRLFYVILLILVAPIVVVFDFFTKFGAK